MFSPIVEGQADRQQMAALSAQQAFKDHFFCYQGRYAQGSAPEGLFALVRWIIDANTAEETSLRVQHALASCQDPERPVNWDWAYTLRGIVRNAAFAQMAGHCSYEQVPVQTWREPGAWLEWLEASTVNDVPFPWVLDIGVLDSLPLLERKSALQNIDNLIASCKDASDQARVALHLTSTTARYLYMRHVQQCQEINKVHRCEIDGKHGLSASIMDALNALSHVELRFLYGLDTQLLSHGISSDQPLPYSGIEQNLQQCGVVGVDIRGPEAVFKPIECQDVITNLYQFLKHLSEQHQRPGPYVLRIHVGESNMVNNEHDPELERIGRQNLEIIISVLEKMQADGAFDLSKAYFRLGHITAITVGQAFRLRQLTHKACMVELNLRSNLQTFASPDMGHLPVLKVLIADALHRYKRKQAQTRSSGFTFLDLTCNTDGAGIMHSSMREEFYLASNVLTHYRNNTMMEDGSRAFVSLVEGDAACLEGCVKAEVHFSDLRQRGLLCEDLKDEVREMLRFALLGKAQPYALSPRKRQRR